MLYFINVIFIVPKGFVHLLAIFIFNTLLLSVLDILTVI